MIQNTKGLSISRCFIVQRNYGNDYNGGIFMLIKTTLTPTCFECMSFVLYIYEIVLFLVLLKLINLVVLNTSV